MKSARTFRGPFFALSYPDHWEELIVEDIPSFFDPDGAGVLQVAAFTREGGDYDLAHELKDYLERQGIDFEEREIYQYKNALGVNAMVCEYTREGRFWLVTVMGKANQLLIVMFNSDEKPDEEMAGQVSGVIQSIHFGEGKVANE